MFYQIIRDCTARPWQNCRLILLQPVLIVLDRAQRLSGTACGGNAIVFLDSIPNGAESDLWVFVSKAGLDGMLSSRPNSEPRLNACHKRDLPGFGGVISKRQPID